MIVDMSLKEIVPAQGKAYCENTSIHGFAYWVAAPRISERIFWVCVVLFGFTCASLIIHTAITDWIEYPGTTGIDTFAKVYLMYLNPNCICFPVNIALFPECS